MASANILTIGSSASLSFLAWRFQVSKSCRLYCVRPWSKLPSEPGNTATATTKANGTIATSSSKRDNALHILTQDHDASRHHLSTSSSSASSTSSAHQEGLISPPSSSSSLNSSTHDTTLVFDSEQFGSSCKFYPDFCYEEVSELDSLGVHFDAILISLDNLRQISKLAKQLSRIADKNTVILFDTSCGVPYLSNIITSKFGNNPDMYSFLGLIMCDEFIVQTAPNRFSHAKAASFNVAGQTIITDIASSSQTPTKDSIRDVVFYLQSAGCNALYQHIKDEFYLLQWQKAIATISLQPLSIILDTPELSVLSQDVMAKPIYEGLMNELYTIAAKQLKDNKSATDRLFPLPPIMTNFDWIPVPKSLQATSCSLLYYLYYCRIDFPTDIYLLQPILLGDELGVKTPYLEFLFAQMTKLAQMNKQPSHLFRRNLDTLPQRKPSVHTTADAASPVNVAATNGDLALREEALMKREKEFARRDQDLARREVMFKRDLQARSSYPVAQTQAQVQGQAPSPVQQYQQMSSNGNTIPNNIPSYNNHNSPHGPPRRHSYTPVRASGDIFNTGVPASPSVGGGPAPHVMPQDINMMSITQRKNRRTSLARSMSSRTINSLNVSVAPDTGRRDPLMHSPSSASLRSPVYSNRHSQQPIDFVLPSDGDRYGNVATSSRAPGATVGSKVPSRPPSTVSRYSQQPSMPSMPPQHQDSEHRNYMASSSSAAAYSQPRRVSHSEASRQGYAKDNGYSNTHSNSNSSPKMPSPPISQTNLLEPDLGGSVSASLSAYMN